MPVGILWYNNVFMQILFSGKDRREVIQGDDSRLYFIDRNRKAVNFLTGIFLLLLISLPLCIQGFFDIRDRGSFVFLILAVISVLFFWFGVCGSHRRELKKPYNMIFPAYRSDKTNFLSVDKNGKESVIVPLSQVRSKILFTRGQGRTQINCYRLYLVSEKENCLIASNGMNESDLKKLQTTLAQFSLVAGD